VQTNLNKQIPNMKSDINITTLNVQYLYHINHLKGNRIMKKIKGNRIMFEISFIFLSIE